MIDFYRFDEIDIEGTKIGVGSTNKACDAYNRPLFPPQGDGCPSSHLLALSLSLGGEGKPRAEDDKIGLEILPSVLWDE